MELAIQLQVQMEMLRKYIHPIITTSEIFKKWTTVVTLRNDEREIPAGTI